VVVDADLGKSTSARLFKERFPERFFTLRDRGAEHDLRGGGLSTMGYTVFATTFAVFAEHAFDQLRMSVAQPNLNVKVVASHGGVSTGEDGASAQSIEDIALFSSLVNFTVCVPGGRGGGRGDHRGGREARGAVVHPHRAPEDPGGLPGRSALRGGQGRPAARWGDLTIVACGLMVERSLRAAEALAGRRASRRAC
jgi:transketolase